MVAGVPLGIVIGWYRRLNLALNPLINGFYATPRIALYPLIIIWFGIGSGSAIFLVFLAATMPILLNTIAGVRNIDADLLRAARAFCATDRQIFRTVALPYSVPFILTGVRQAVAHGLIAVIIAELMAGNQGIGFMIAYAGQTFATDTLLVGVLLTSLAGMLLGWLTERLQRYFQRWRPSHELTPGRGCDDGPRGAAAGHRRARAAPGAFHVRHRCDRRHHRGPRRPPAWHRTRSPRCRARRRWCCGARR
ncbi:MAG: ABC transporter permease [Rubrivivax sp.]